ncbi:MAG: dipicolinate synthase subunit B [Firmicutes bacterium]|nr:dipicolinate synthase subunit B [Bacillota bacterium]
METIVKNIGFAITGSFCTFNRILAEIQRIAEAGYNVIPIFSFAVAEMDTRFGTAADFRRRIVEITGKEPVDTLVLAEPLGPSGAIDLMAVAPCTGNTLAKITHAITDTPVTMAVKAHFRNNKPVVIAVSSNDLLGINFRNLGTLMSMKNIYFVPFGQDDHVKKPKSLISDYSLLLPAIEKAARGEQLQPLLVSGGK